MVVAGTEAEADQRTRIGHCLRLPAMVGLIAAHRRFTRLIPGSHRTAAQIVFPHQSLLDLLRPLGIDFLLSACDRLAFAAPRSNLFRRLAIRRARFGMAARGGMRAACALRGSGCRRGRCLLLLGRFFRRHRCGGSGRGLFGGLQRGRRILRKSAASQGGDTRAYQQRRPYFPQAVHSFLNS